MAVDIDFNAPAVLRKWPSLNSQRIAEAWGGVPYLISEGTLDQCIKQLMSRHASQHLYEIHTKPQPPLVTEILQFEHVVELGRLRDFL